jgi:tetrahydromethanopterin S-methyltransferase subunit G
VKLRESEYIIDRLNENIAALESRIEALVKENKETHEECKFGAAVGLMFGIALGVVIGTVIAWQ